MEKQRIIYLLKRHRKLLLTQEEEQELLDFVRTDPEGALFVEAMMEDAESEVFEYPGDAVRWKEMANKIITIDRPAAAQLITGSVTPVRFLRKLSWAAAVAVILLIGSGVYFFINRTNEKPTIAVSSHAQDVQSPSINRATIKLANGQKIFLDSMIAGQQTVQGTVKLVKLADGQIAYSGQADLTAYNTLTNPKGSTVINITLTDGSKVWLNTASSITYPVAFIGNERKISVSGEAYFEVAHDASRPFIVTKGDVEINVLGTHFNVNAYEDEDAIKVTLLEGSVRIHDKNNQRLLVPGQQARLNMTGDIQVVHDEDLEQVMAWKNGFFKLTDTELPVVLRQVSRWYDVTVVYEGGIPSGHLTGKVLRKLNLSEVVKLMKYSGFNVRVENKQLIVSQ